MKAPAYDRMGIDYAQVRRADPRIEAAIHAALGDAFEQLEALLPNPRFAPIPVPSDCADGFCVALWSRPEAHLDPNIRRSSSIWHCLPEAVVDKGLERLRADLESGEWDRRYGELRTQDSLDVGLRLVTAQLP